MIKRYAEIENDLIVNVSVWDGETIWETGKEIIELPDDSAMGIGWQRIKGVWQEPEIDPAIIALQKAIAGVKQLEVNEAKTK
jgi:hypothetical protein